MTPFKLRDAQPDDSAAIATIYQHYVRTSCFTFEEVAPNSDEIGARMRKTREAGLPYYVPRDQTRALSAMPMRRHFMRARPTATPLKTRFTSPVIKPDGA